MKPLMLVNGRPLIQHAIQHATVTWNAQTTTIVASPDNARPLASVLTRPEDFHWALQPSPVSVVDAIKRGMRYQHAMTLILCADNVFDNGGKELLRTEGYIANQQPAFGSQTLPLDAATRFTRWNIRSDFPGVTFYEATNHKEAAKSQHCWIGPLLLSTARVHAVLERCSVHIPIHAFIQECVGRVENNIVPIEMRCLDMGTIESVTG